MRWFAAGLLAAGAAGFGLGAWSQRQPVDPCVEAGMAGRGYSATVPKLVPIPATGSPEEKAIAEAINDVAKQHARVLFYVHSSCRRGPLR